jgi:hypothetical protein
MATIITITKQDTKESIEQKLKDLALVSDSKKGFSASHFTGKVNSFGDGIEYQRKVRNEWK